MSVEYKIKKKDVEEIVSEIRDFLLLTPTKQYYFGTSVTTYKEIANKMKKDKEFAMKFIKEINRSTTNFVKRANRK